MITRRRILAASGAVLASTQLRKALAYPATPAAGGEEILVPVELKEWEIAPTQRVFRVGQPYRFEVTNAGALVHEWVIEPADADDEPLERESESSDMPAESELVDIGVKAAKMLTWTFTDPGDYKMVCHIEGHSEAGMHVPFSVIADAQIVDAETTEFSIKLSAETVKAGSPIAFVVQNHGKLTHELVIEPIGGNDEPFEIDGHGSEIEDITPGSRREIIWTFDEPIDLQTVCHIPGHMEAGMIAFLTVTA